MLKVKEVSTGLNVLILHGMSKAGLKNVLPKDITLESQLKHAIDGYSTNSTEIMNAFSFKIHEDKIKEHLMKPFGLILKDGNIVWINESDLGSTDDTNSHKGFEPTELDSLINIISSKRELHNEIHIKNPEILGFYVNVFPIFDYAKEEVQMNSEQNTLPTFYIDNNSCLYKITWNGDKLYTLTKLSWEEFKIYYD